MENVQQWMTCSVHGDLEVLVNEIRQFAEVFGKVLVDSTPHLYISGLPFIPKKSKLQNAYSSHFPRVARLCYGHNSWWPQLQVLMQGTSTIGLHLLHSLLMARELCLAQMIT
ncbi:hypothetical protein BT96DRAFT_601617 [Gymnopus androsaceus JB14]|uniref:Uncharacterized protein n=1 Tax=Gymnopus androsaceus JB14 TaxID=1447944 RepID=A0A6A4GI14_9AGAR|nr:hypothetical protein BT96DRAFT_601617 [Gymnopus androsaceus JB14]